MESELFQRGGEEGHLLKAVAASPVLHEFPLHAVQIELNGPTQEDVEVLEGNMCGVRQEQARERRSRSL